MSRHDSMLGKQCQAGLDPTSHSLNTSVLKAMILLTSVCSLFLSLDLPRLRWSSEWIMALKNSLGSGFYALVPCTSDFMSQASASSFVQ